MRKELLTGLILILLTGISREISVDTSKANIDIDTSDLPEGNYYLNIFQNNEVIQKQIILIRH